MALRRASRLPCFRFRDSPNKWPPPPPFPARAALLEEALADPFLAGTPGSASAAALKHAALKNLGRVLDAAGDASAPAALDAYAAAAELDASDVVLWCAPRERARRRAFRARPAAVSR